MVKRYRFSLSSIFKRKKIKILLKVFICLMFINVSSSQFIYNRISTNFQNKKIDEINSPITSAAPNISVYLPTNYSLYGRIAPNYSLNIAGGPGNYTWYEFLDTSENSTFLALNALLNEDVNGTFEQSMWDNLSNGTVTIRFYANDTIGNLNWTDIIVRVDFDSPSITINTPADNGLFNSTAPKYNVSINDPSGVNTSWYTIDDGSTNFTFSGSIGTINQTAWDSEGNGTISIRFYANDTIGNVNWEEVTVRQDAEKPSITINSPSNSDVLNATAPIFNVSISDGNLDTMWYFIYGSSVNRTFTGNGPFNQNDWDNIVNGTLTTITFYANDTLGNENSQSINIYVDKLGPTIIINSPIDNDVQCGILLRDHR
ncbi:MAG: hypothetical protein ACW98D_14860 [Promethearchaeota archaeon]|jgi:hypothetical protein